MLLRASEFSAANYEAFAWTWDEPGEPRVVSAQVWNGRYPEGPGVWVLPPDSDAALFVPGKTSAAAPPEGDGARGGFKVEPSPAGGAVGYTQPGTGGEQIVPEAAEPFDVLHLRNAAAVRLVGEGKRFYIGDAFAVGASGISEAEQQTIRPV